MQSRLKFVLCLLVLFSSVIFCQSEFPIGVFGGGDTNHILYNSDAYNSLKTSGTNYIISESRAKNKSDLSKYNLVAMNGRYASDIIYHNTNGMYTKWEAERDTFAPLETGFKHALVSPGSETFLGKKETYKGAVCWSTDNLTTPIDNWLTGPNYYQDKQYRLNYVPAGASPNNAITFTVNFIMALDPQIPLQDPNAEVCRIHIVHGSCLYINGQKTDTYIYNNIEGPNCDRTLKVSDFSSHGDFDTFKLAYTYPDSLWPPEWKLKNDDGYTIATDKFYDDGLAKTGIEFRVDWKGVGKLYIDYVEVYDNAIWGYYLDHTPSVTDQINTYLTNYSSWSKLKYWYCIDEPQSIDYYYPIKHLQEILDSLSPGSELITEFMPQWNGQKNGDVTISKFKELAQPKKMMIDYYPFDVNVTNEFYLARFRERLQELHYADPNFWYVGQGFGQKVNLGDLDFCGWRKPSPAELNSSVMLALAHGAKGIMFWKYFTEDYSNKSATCSAPRVYYDCLVGLPASNFAPSNLADYLRLDLLPRLKGSLGNKLLELNYSGISRQSSYFIPTQILSSPPPTYEYLTIDIPQPIQSVKEKNWHAGLFDRPDHPDDKYFMLVNLLPGADNTINIRITPPVPGYSNYRFKDIEGRFDETFSSEITKTLSFPKGEGYLYEVAPVVRYGGKLLYNETISGTNTLTESMAIKSGATLTVSGVYNIQKNITIEYGGELVVSPGATLNFSNGATINVNGGTLTSAGSSNSKITYEFNSGPGIVIGIPK